MSDPQHTEALMQRYFEALNSSAFDALAGLLDDDLTYDEPGGERVLGADGFARSMMDRARHYDERIADLVIMVAAGGQRAAAEYTIRGVYRESAPDMPASANQSYSVAGGTFFELDGDRISRITSYTNEREWRRQLGG